MSTDPGSSGRPSRHAEDLGPSGFDPHAPYTRVEPMEAEVEGYPMNSNDRNLALLAHLLGCLGIVVGSVPGFIGPLVIWLMYKDKSSYVEEQAREALNFQITLLLIAIGCGVLTLVTCGALFPLVFVPIALQVIFGIIASIAASRGERYRYPFNFRLVQ